MKFGLASGLLWALDTVILGIALAMSPFVDTAEAIALASIVGAALHDVFCAAWLFLYMAFRRRLKDTSAALKTRGGKIVMLGALLGGPVGMTGYVISISNIGAAYTAIISSFYPAFGAVLAVAILKEKMLARQVISLLAALVGVVVMGYLAADTTITGDPLLGVLGAVACVVGWGSEAVLGAWGMRDESVDNETALQIRETTSALVYCVLILPLFGALDFTLSTILSAAEGIIGLAAAAGAASYLFYYKGIAVIGAAKGMALNISYSAWAVLFGAILLGTSPGLIESVCCVVVFAGTVLAASDWKALFAWKGRIG